jgi:hypothetical protein
MGKKLYYTDPLQAAYMSREFGVKWKERDGRILADDNNYNTVIFHHGRYSVHPDSYHVFEPQVGDIIKHNEMGNLNTGTIEQIKRETNEDYDEKEEWERVDIFMSWDVKNDYTLDVEIEQIIQRDGKPFFNPEVE